MDCREVQRLLVDFMEGLIFGKCKEELEAHIESCVNCQRERDFLSKSWQMLGSYGSPKPPDDFTASLMRRIHSEQAEFVKVRYTRPWLSFPRLAPVFATVLVVVLAVSLYWKNPRVQPPQPAPAAMLDKDREIIQNLDILQNADLLQNINIAKDLDTIESTNAGTT